MVHIILATYFNHREELLTLFCPWFSSETDCPFGKYHDIVERTGHAV